jgi:hypothetical protein
MQMYTTGNSLALKRATYTEYINISASVFLARIDTNAKPRTFKNISVCTLIIHRHIS